MYLFLNPFIFSKCFDIFSNSNSGVVNGTRMESGKRARKRLKVQVPTEEANVAKAQLEVI